MTKITLQEAQISLGQLIHRLPPGEEVIITENDIPIARLVATSATQPLRKLGTLSGTVKYIAPDFDAPLEGFEDCSMVAQES
ncbi:MAG: type II toxin-antitoxin system prevent-host-death family antitoxin [Anaerolineae bacterium]|nr:type II toxin-antitoxin system prevent-host-death family antitoxin [Gloeobacterales cyanobacterium ES-bin-313]